MLNKSFIINLVFLCFVSLCGKASPLRDKMHQSLQTSLNWRDTSTGIWEKTGWWNSANLLTAVIRYSKVTGDKTVLPVIEDIFRKAKHYQIEKDSIGNPQYCNNFINDYYDDEGWWALAWIDAYKLTGNKAYLSMSQTIFKDMTTSWSDLCGGGVFWKKNPLHYKNSIANNLFSLTAIRLYRATGGKDYRDWFCKNVSWYLHSGMMNTTNNMVEDGLNDDCTPNRNAYYTYNQGVALAVFTEMYLLEKDKKYLQLAQHIADATLQHTFVTERGILKEMRPNIEKSNDGVQFKGIFIRHLAFLYKISKCPRYKEFILRNAESIITNDYDSASKSFGCFWYGLFSEVNPAANSCALECVIEAYDLSKVYRH